MPGRQKKDLDAEIDLHGLSLDQARIVLQREWPNWRSLRAVRIITGQGVALKPEVMRWSEDLGLPCREEPYNPGSLRIFPRERSVPHERLTVSLRDSGLAPTPEQAEYLRDPEAAERRKREQAKRDLEAERDRRLQLAEKAKRDRLDDLLWQAELRRLGSAPRSAKRTTDSKPSAPVVAPTARIEFNEGYWRSELVRVADTEEQQLRKEKRTGLDKLAPPIPAPQTLDRQAPGAPAPAPARDASADRTLFEAEMERLEADAPYDLMREKR